MGTSLVSLGIISANPLLPLLCLVVCTGMQSLQPSLGTSISLADGVQAIM